MKLLSSAWMHPVTRRRWQRFRGMRRAWWSLGLLTGLYLLSLGAELICNERPLLIRFEGRTLIPIFSYISERELLGDGHLTRVDFKEFAASERFRADPRNRIWWTLHPCGPREIIQPASIALPDVVEVKLSPEPHLATVQVAPDWTVSRGVSAGIFFGVEDGREDGQSLQAGWEIPDAIREGVLQRLRNEAAPAVVAPGRSATGRSVELSLPPYSPRAAAPSAPRTVRLTCARSWRRARKPPPAWSARDGSWRTSAHPRCGAACRPRSRARVLDQARQRAMRAVENAGAGNRRRAASRGSRWSARKSAIRSAP